MHRYSTCLFAIIVSLALAGASLAAEPDAVAGKIDAVTVYRGQALVTRILDVAGAAGLREIVVSDLPAQVIGSSIFAEAGAGIEVRSVRYRERPILQDVREDVRKLDDEIRNLSDQVTANERQRQLLEEQKTYLGKLEQFTAPTA